MADDASNPTLAVQQRALALLQQIDANPDAKVHLERAIKAAVPGTVTDEDRAQQLTAPVLEQVKGIEAKLDEFLTSQKSAAEAAADAAAQRSLDEQFSALRQRGYTDEGIGRIKQLMLDRTIADPEAAALLFDKLNPPPPAEHASYSPQGWDIGAAAANSDDLKLLFTNEDAWEDRKIAETLNEIRLGKAA